VQQIHHISVARNASLALVAGMGLMSSAMAADVLVTSNISTSTTWTANNVYKLETQVYVLPGATLTIEAGTLIASRTNVGGSLAVARGGQIIALGTQSQPIIFTSDADVATWIGGDRRSGTWRESANEWGNVTLMGRGYLSENAIAGNTAAPNASNIGAMEGLVAAFPGDPNVLYGGGDDDDDSGTLRYVSLRYTGRVVALNNELNGLSMGGVGRGTDVTHVEIMNNVDDGIEIWGGKVNVKNFAIWNIGDDSLDVDQGWRGKVQFGLIVQGHSLNASSGSGVCDNMMEMDGAENSDWQPVTSAVAYNMTLIGQPAGGDHATAWRDNARVQIRNSILMDVGRNVVNFDNIDGDGGAGYGHNGTLSWPATWTTDFNVYSTVNAPASPAAFYTAQTSGKLAEISDSVFFRNLNATANNEAIARGVFAAGNNNVDQSGLIDPNAAPIRAITRSGPITRGGRTLLPVATLDPRATNAAATSVATAPTDGFFSPVGYRGAFSPNGASWLCDWTASDAFGFTSDECVGTNYCVANSNSVGLTGALSGTGSANLAANNLVLNASNLPPNEFTLFVVSQTQGFVATPGTSLGNLCLAGNIGRYTGPGQIQNAGPAGAVSLAINNQSIPQPAAFVAAAVGQTWNFQCWHRDTVGGQPRSNFTVGLSITFE